MKKLMPIGVLLAAALFACSVSAQSIPVGSTNLSGTIAVTNTFQTIQGQTNNRLGCAIQNNGTNTMYVFLGPKASATTAKSIVLSPGQPMSCEVSGAVVVKDEINITGTSGDAYLANFQ
jgi:hypothetical protein